MRTEGFQRAMGKPFGRARRRETFCICKNAYKTCKKNEAKYFVNALRAGKRLLPGPLRLSKNPREVSEGPQPLRLSFVSDGFAGGAGR